MFRSPFRERFLNERWAFSVPVCKGSALKGFAIAVLQLR